MKKSNRNTEQKSQTEPQSETNTETKKETNTETKTETKTQTKPKPQKCPLCHQPISSKDRIYSETTRFEAKMDYHLCGNCALIFIPAPQHLPPNEERLRYDQHENDPTDAEYRRFLSRLAGPLLEKLPPQCEGLDFGSGPGPALHLLFEKEGHTMALYDPFYHPDPGVFGKKYDFIVSSETFEHLSDPAGELHRLWNLLRPEGILGIMTLRYSSDIDFSGWHYRMDDTHVCFYSDATFRWIARNLNANIHFVSKRVVLLHKRSPVR